MMESPLQVKTSEGRNEKQRSTLKQVLGNSSLNGISHIASSSTRLSFCFWGLVLIGGLIGFGFNITALIVRFMQGPVLESYTPEVAPFVWPDITICNPVNPLPLWSYSSAQLRLWNDTIANTTAYGKALFKRGFTTRFTHQLAMSSMNPKTAMSDEVSRMIFDVIKNNLRAGESVLLAVNSEKLFKLQYRDHYYSRLTANRFQLPCITFNPAGFNSSSEAYKKGQDIQSVKMLLIMDLRSYNIFDADYDNRKLSIFVSAPNRTTSMINRHFALPGTDGFLHLTMTHTTRLLDRGCCISKPFEIELYDAAFEKTKVFYGDFDDCEMFVQQRTVLEKCGCYDPSMPIFKSHQSQPRLCLNMTIFSEEEVADNLDCIRGLQRNNFESLKSQVKKKCSEFLKPPCQKVSYQVSHDLVPWSSDISPGREKYMMLLGNTLSNFMQINPTSVVWKFQRKSFLRKNLAFLTIQKNHKMGDIIVEEYSYGFPQFISDIGGICGLWMGLSVIGMFEIIEIFCSSCRALCN